MNSLLKGCRFCPVALLVLLGCQEATPKPSKPGKSANVGQGNIPQEGMATRELESRWPIDDMQRFREPDLALMWCGEVPGSAEVYVNGAYVGRGRPGFVVAVKSFDNVPRRGKILLVHSEPQLVLRGDSSNIADLADPFSAWPDLGSVFLRMLADKEVCLDVRGGGVLDQRPHATNAKEDEIPHNDSADRHKSESD